MQFYNVELPETWSAIIDVMQQEMAEFNFLYG